MENINNYTYLSLEQLNSILSESGYICLGHGTGRSKESDETIDDIFKTGLRTKDNSLYFTTEVLSTPTPELKQQYADIGLPEPTIARLKNKLNNWEHLKSSKIIIARIPVEFINKTGDRSDLDGEMYGAFFTKKTNSNGTETYYLNPKYIIGCFDAEKQAVRLNKKFERYLTPTTIEELKEGYKEALNKTKTRLQSFEKKPIISNNQGQSSPSEIDYHLAISILMKRYII